jgi:hypothetical protein
MTFDEVLKHFGGKYQIAKACAVGKSTPFTWCKRGFIPYGSQRDIEELTGGELKADYKHGRRQ